MNALSVRGCPQYINKNSLWGGDLNIEVDLNLQENIQGSDGNVVKLSIIRRIVDLKMLIK
jgi:hypothetical protein